MPKYPLIGQRSECEVFLMIILFVSALGRHPAQAQVKADAGANGFDFQAFINNPPVIQEMVFASEKPPLVQGGTNRQPTQFFLLRWESPLHFIMATAPSLSELAEGAAPLSSTWYSAGKSHWWHLVAVRTNQFLLRLWETTTPSDKRRNPVLITVNTVRHVNVDHVLKLGIAYAPTSGVVWEGDSFTFTNVAEKTTGAGQLARDDAGRVQTVFHTFSRPILVGKESEIRTFRHRIDYTYDNGLERPKDFPSQIDLLVLRENAPPFFSERIRIHRLVTATTPLAESQLAFEPLVKGHQVIRWITTNDTEHVFDGKAWQPVPDPGVFERSTTVSRWALIFVVVMLLAPTILLAIWARKKKKAAES